MPPHAANAPIVDPHEYLPVRPLLLRNHYQQAFPAQADIACLYTCLYTCLRSLSLLWGPDIAVTALGLKNTAHGLYDGPWPVVMVAVDGL